MKILPIILLACANAQAVTIDRFLADEREVRLPFFEDNLDNPFLNPNYSISWQFTGTTFDGHWYVRGSERLTKAEIHFTLDEPIGFSLTGSIRQPEWLPISFSSLNVALGPHMGNTSVLDLNGPGPFTLTGILSPGQHVLEVNGYAFSTESDSFLKLAFVPVPDAGSTLLLLGVALCALAARKR